MSGQAYSAADSPPAAASSRAARASRWGTLYNVRRWELAVGGAALASAVAAFWLTVNADFLAHPEWLALQKADAILGPVAVGLYWRRRRPDSLFGLLLIGFGFVLTPYILQSSATSELFTAGVAWEAAIYVATLAIILTFPTGRLRGLPERVLLAAGALVVPGLTFAFIALSPQISGEGSISGCLGPCPANAGLVSAEPDVARRLLELDRAAIITIAVATFFLIVWRIASGTPPQRRALFIGGPVVLLFLATQATYHATTWAAVNPGGLNTAVRWTLVGTRASIWYGFLLALLAAEIFAGRVLRRILAASLERRSLKGLEATLREPLGDPSLRLAFWRPGTRSWVDAEGDALETPGSQSGRSLTVVERDGRPAAAALHDVQLEDDPELVQAAGGSGTAGTRKRRARGRLGRIGPRAPSLTGTAGGGQRGRATEAGAGPPRRGTTASACTRDQFSHWPASSTMPRSDRSSASWRLRSRARSTSCARSPTGSIRASSPISASPRLCGRL